MVLINIYAIITIIDSYLLVYNYSLNRGCVLQRNAPPPALDNL